MARHPCEGDRGHQLLGEFGVPVVYHPDILLAAPELLGVERDRPDSVLSTVGVNIFHRTGQALADESLAIATARPDLRLIFINSHLPSRPQRYEIQPISGLDNVTLHSDNDPVETSRMLASPDLLITSKLNLG